MRRFLASFGLAAAAALPVTMPASALVISVTPSPMEQTVCAGAGANWVDDVFFVNPPQDIFLDVDFGDGTSSLVSLVNQSGPHVLIPITHVFPNVGTYAQLHSARDAETNPPQTAGSTVHVVACP